MVKARPESPDHPGHGQAGQEIKSPGNRDEQASPAWSEQGQSLALKTGWALGVDQIFPCTLNMTKSLTILAWFASICELISPDYSLR